MAARVAAGFGLGYHPAWLEADANSVGDRTDDRCDRSGLDQGDLLIGLWDLNPLMFTERLRPTRSSGATRRTRTRKLRDVAQQLVDTRRLPWT
jgi:hypothetical protein